jgi:hypothetical protein
MKEELDNLNQILFVSHKAKQCGVYQYGLNIAQALQHSIRYSFIYAECENAVELQKTIAQKKPSAIIYNYHPATMPWLDRETICSLGVINIGTIHEVTQEVADRASTELFDYYIAPDPTLIPNNPIVFKTGRLIPKYQNNYSLPKITTIGSFGFATEGKGFERLIISVQDEFDEAIIRLHIPTGDFASFSAKDLVRRCQNLIIKPKIQLVITHDFLSQKQLLDFLAQNTLNAFFYEKCQRRGISSVIDYALAVHRPIAITNSTMFRHLLLDKNFTDYSSICIEEEIISPKNLNLKNKIQWLLSVVMNRLSRNKPFQDKIPAKWFWWKKRATLKEIITNGDSLERFRSEWSQDNLIMDYERILDRILGKLKLFESHIPNSDSELQRKPDMSAGILGIHSFNRILDDVARKQYQPTVEKLSILAPDIITRKIPEANIQQAFVMDTVMKFTPPTKDYKILCIGSFEDTATIALKKLGYKIEEIDPVLNYDLATFFHQSSTVKHSYDVIFSTSVLEHVRNDELFLSQIVELLAPKGTSILTFDYNDFYQSGNLIPIENYRFYTQKDLKQRIIPLLKGCSLVDDPEWDCLNPDFVYAGKYRYTFATMVFQKNKL